MFARSGDMWFESDNRLGEVMLRWIRHPVLGLALLAVVTSACAVEVRGTPVPAAGSARPSADDEIRSDDVIGNPTLWNPCSVVDPDAVPAGWTARVDIPAAYEYCVMSVTTDDAATAEVQVGYLHESTEDPAEDEDAERPGGLSVLPHDSGDNACERLVVFADDIALVVRSWPEDAADKDAMCAISDTVAGHVVDAIVAGESADLELPEDTIGTLDPCELATPEMLAAVPGFTPNVAADPQLSGHSCWWEADSGVMVNVEFQIGRLPVGDSGSTVHGRYTTVTEYADDESSSLCVVDGEHVKFEYESVNGLMERVGIWVYLQPGQTEAACTAANALADAMWPKLPPL